MFGKKKISVSTDSEAVEALLSRSVASILPSKEDFKKSLMSGKRLKIYIGADATGPQLHLGTATNFILLEKLRQLGHEVVVLFGDFTAMIGDPTDKEATRKILSKVEVAENIKTWKDQVGKILNFKDKKNPATLVKNSEWLSKLSFTQLIELASSFTVQQMLERDMFQKRLEEKKPIYIHEFFYPLMQGYDSVAMNVDVEIGGNDQTFNMLVGRTLQKKYNNKEKFVIATTLLVNPKTGVKLMNKSTGSYIALNDEPNNMFGKVMALPDEVIVQVFTDCTYVSLADIGQIKSQLEGGSNPRDAKIRLAREIVTLYHNSAAAEKAEANFNTVFSGGGMPNDAQEINVPSGTPLADALVEFKVISSKSDWRRLVDGGGVHVIGEAGPTEKITDYHQKISGNINLKIGARRFVRITFN